MRRPRTARRVTLVLLLFAVALGVTPAFSRILPHLDRQRTGAETKGGDRTARERTRVVEETLSYARRDGRELKLDVFRSRDASKDPVIALMYGGLWRNDNRKLWVRHAARIVQAGYVLVLPEVRLAPPGGDDLSPAPVKDLSASIRWLRKNAVAIGGDPRRIGLIGSSSGAHLALMAAGTGTGRPDAVAAYSPPIDLADLQRNNIVRRAIDGYLGCPPDDCPARYRRASPLTAMDASTPPTLLAYSIDDRLPRSHARRLMQHLGGLGVVTRTIEADGDAHGLELSHRVLGTTLRFMDRHL